MLAYLEKKRKPWYIWYIMSTSQPVFSDNLWERGLERVYPSTGELDEFLQGGGRLKVFLGLDPTGPHIHIGHGSILLKLRDLQAAGHQITILIGDFTAMIGDPTDKTSARRKLSAEEVKANYQSYQSQIAKILDLSQIKFVFNKEWLGRLNFEEVVEIASEFTVSQMIERDMFQERLKRDEPIYLHEFLYPLMQGYDSVQMDINAEIGGSDQTFNMLTGRTMMKRRGQEKFVLTTKLLVDPTGKKMGKSEGNMVTLSDEPALMYGKIMSWPDTLMPLAFEICTRVPAAEVETILSEHPRDAKMRLAREIVSIFAGDDQVEAAEADFIAKFQTSEVPEQVEVFYFTAGDMLRDVLIKAGLVESKAEYKRLVDGGGITVLPDSKVSTLTAVVSPDQVIRVGKKKFIKLSVKGDE